MPTKGWTAWFAAKVTPATQRPSSYEGPLRSFVFLRSFGVNRNSRSFASFVAIRSEVEWSGEIVFIKRGHLPADFEEVLSKISGQEKVNLVVFCRQINELRCGYSPPKVASERMEASSSPSNGLPINTPAMRLDISDAYSFGRKEVFEFLGLEHFFSAGHAIVLPLPPDGKGPEYYNETLPTILARLQ